MCDASHGRLVHQIDRVRCQERSQGGLPFSSVLDCKEVQQVIEAEGGQTRQCDWDPLTTVMAFLGQVLDKDGSCRQAVARVLAWRVSQGQRPDSAATGPYCKARQRLPEAVVSHLARQVGQDLHNSMKLADNGDHPARALLGGRPIKMVDGATVSMPDTPANQAAWPQAGAQKPGLGFPIMRIVTLISLTCGAMLDVALGPCRGKGRGETALFRELLHHFAAGDVALGDRYYASYWTMALLHERGADGLFRAWGARKIDFRTGRRLGPLDHLVQWRKPPRPDWMDEQIYARLPDRLWVREVRITVSVPGLRVQHLTLTTTLLDHRLYPAQELARVYRCRWHAELDIRSIKVAMGMEVLRCKSPSMVRKELWMHVMAYNLIRTVMARAAEAHQTTPREISFTGAMQTLRAWAPLLTQGGGPLIPTATAYAALLDAIAQHRVGDRPNRVEPRAIKRRPKPHKLLQVPRAQARTLLLAS